MARHSQNGWPVVTKGRCDQGPFEGVKFPNGILGGDVATIARWQLDRYVRTVEPLIAGTCWGWFDRTIAGTDFISNHASATAWDINASRHALGAPAEDSLTPAQIDACDAIVAAAGGVLRWGGRYRGRKDVMHWEIIGTQSEAARFAAAIRLGGRKITIMELTVKVPQIRQGDRDDLLPGYNLISRMQAIVGADRDGVWGPATTAAIARWCKLDSAECRTLTEVVYRRVFGAGE